MLNLTYVYVIYSKLCKFTHKPKTINKMKTTTKFKMFLDYDWCQLEVVLSPNSLVAHNFQVCIFLFISNGGKRLKYEMQSDNMM